jgi:hypothetical protein
MAGGQSPRREPESCRSIKLPSVYAHHSGALGREEHAAEQHPDRHVSGQVCVAYPESCAILLA